MGRRVGAWFTRNCPTLFGLAATSGHDGALRVLITRSGPLPNSSAQAQPPSSQSSWPGACASVSTANTQRLRAAAVGDQPSGAARKNGAR